MKVQHFKTNSKGKEIEIKESDGYFIVPPEMDGYTCFETRYKVDSGTGSFTMHIRDSETSKASTTVNSTSNVTWNHADFVINTDDEIDFEITAVATSGLTGISATIRCEP